MHDFKWQRARSLAEARSAVGAAQEGRYLAGGQTLLPVLKQRLAAPSHLIDLAGIDDLQGLAVTAEAVTIGAMTRHADVAASVAVQRAIPALAELAGGIGDPHVRNRGTIGGSLANNDPAADYPAALLGLAGTVQTDRREIAADAFFQGLFTTALDEGEIIVRVTFPIPRCAGYVKFPHPASRYCMVGVMVSDGPRGIRVAATGAGQSGVFRVQAMEAQLSASFTPAALDGIVVPPDDIMSDLHASAAYRAHLVGVLAKRAVAKALAPPSLAG